MGNSPGNCVKVGWRQMASLVIKGLTKILLNHLFPNKSVTSLSRSNQWRLLIVLCWRLRLFLNPSSMLSKQCVWRISHWQNNYIVRCTFSDRGYLRWELVPPMEWTAVVCVVRPWTLCIQVYYIICIRYYIRMIYYTY